MPARLVNADRRREEIAEAAMHVLAVKGARGLTHRAVDRYMDVPEGSTSNYFRTKSALLAAVYEHVIRMDEKFLDSLRRSAATMPPGKQSTAAWLATAMVAYFLDPEQVEKQRARFEVSLMTSCVSSAREEVVAMRRGFRKGLIAIVAGFGIVIDDVTARNLIGFADGIIYDRTLGTSDSAEVDKDELERVFLAILDG